MINLSLEKGIRCQCGKYWGMRNHKRTCKKCKTTVIARGNKSTLEGNKNEKWYFKVS